MVCINFFRGRCSLTLQNSTISVYVADVPSQTVHKISFASISSGTCSLTLPLSPRSLSLSRLCVQRPNFFFHSVQDRIYQLTEPNRDRDRHKPILVDRRSRSGPVDRMSVGLCGTLIIPSSYHPSLSSPGTVLGEIHDH